MSKYTGMEMRKVYASFLEELYKEDKDIYALEADLSSSMATASLKEKLGKNYVNVGIMEANMISVAAGLNITGGFPFIHSFGQFLARRAMDQIFISLAYANFNACLVGSDAGVTAEHNGGTHMTFEDMGILRLIPNITIYDVCDPSQLATVLKNAYDKKGLTYIRTFRKKPQKEIYDENEDFSNCGAKVIKEGKDISIIACGIEVAEALKAQEILKSKGIEAEVIDAFRIKPLDYKVILDSVKKTNLVITCENHFVENGLGSAVAEYLSEIYPVKMYRIGVRGKFGQVGKLDYLKKEYGLDAENIVKKSEELLSK